jgi:hypothetical protein
VTAIETDGIPRKEPSHQAGQRHSSGAQKEVCVVRQQGPGVANRFRLREQKRQAIHKIVVISQAQKYLATLYPSDDDMVQDAGCVQTG